jgi:hypothetical protein
MKYKIKVWDDAGRQVFKDEEQKPEELGRKLNKWLRKFN